jgi:hypothetical protein
MRVPSGLIAAHFGILPNGPKAFAIDPARSVNTRRYARGSVIGGVARINTSPPAFSAKIPRELGADHEVRAWVVTFQRSSVAQRRRTIDSSSPSRLKAVVKESLGAHGQGLADARVNKLSSD